MKKVALELSRLLGFRLSQTGAMVGDLKEGRSKDLD